MQDDDTSNPGDAVGARRRGAVERARRAPPDKACADCHGDAAHQHERRRGALSGLRRRRAAGPIDLEQRIKSVARTSRQATPLAFESKELLALTAYIGRQSRGMPIDDRERRAHAAVHRGRARPSSTGARASSISSCAQCHDDNWGQKLAGAPIPQGHPTGYPLYRLEWQSARIAAAAAAQLPDRHARRALCVRRARIRRSRALSDVARARHAGRDPAVRP